MQVRSVDLGTANGEMFAPSNGLEIEGSAFGLRALFRLVEVQETPDFAVPDGRVPFSLIFHGPKGLDWPQGTVTFMFPDLGEAEIFVVPIGMVDRGAGPAGGMVYQACFN